jgi:low affinity Fe/Cu permease
MRQRFNRIVDSVIHALGTPTALATATLAILIWAVTGPLFGFSDTWQLVINTATTIVTFLMVFVIQNGQNRDAKAVHIKLDELIRTIDGARNHLVLAETQSEDEQDREIEQLMSIAQEAGRSPSPEVMEDFAEAGANFAESTAKVEVSRHARTDHRRDTPGTEVASESD